MNILLFPLIAIAALVLLVVIVLLKSLHSIGPAQVGLVTKRIGRKLDERSVAGPPRRGRLPGRPADAGAALQALADLRRRALRLGPGAAGPRRPRHRPGRRCRCRPAPSPRDYRPEFGNFASIRTFLDNGGQRGVQRPVLPPGTTAPIHPIGFVVVTSDRTFGKMVSESTKQAVDQVDPSFLKVVNITPQGDRDLVGVVTTLEGPPSGDIASRIGGFNDVPRDGGRRAARRSRSSRPCCGRRTSCTTTTRTTRPSSTAAAASACSTTRCCTARTCSTRSSCASSCARCSSFARARSPSSSPTSGCPPRTPRARSSSSARSCSPATRASGPSRCAPASTRSTRASTRPRSCRRRSSRSTGPISRARPTASTLGWRRSTPRARRRSPSTSTCRCRSTSPTHEHRRSSAWSARCRTWSTRCCSRPSATTSATSCRRSARRSSSRSATRCSTPPSRTSSSTCRATRSRPAASTSRTSSSRPTSSQVLTSREIAAQERATFAQQREAQVARVSLEQQRGVADMQSQLAAGQRLGRHRAVAGGGGAGPCRGRGRRHHDHRRCRGHPHAGHRRGRRAAAEEALGLARAAGFDAQRRAIGAEQTALVAALREVGVGHVKIVPDVQVGADSGVLGGLGALLMRSLTEGSPDAQPSSPNGDERRDSVDTDATP